MMSYQRMLRMQWSMPMPNDGFWQDFVVAAPETDSRAWVWQTRFLWQILEKRSQTSRLPENSDAKSIIMSWGNRNWYFRCVIGSHRTHSRVRICLFIYVSRLTIDAETVNGSKLQSVYFRRHEAKCAKTNMRQSHCSIIPTKTYNFHTPLANSNRTIVIIAVTATTSISAFCLMCCLVWRPRRHVTHNSQIIINESINRIRYPNTIELDTEWEAETVSFRCVLCSLWRSRVNIFPIFLARSHASNEVISTGDCQ